LKDFFPMLIAEQIELPRSTCFSFLVFSRVCLEHDKFAKTRPDHTHMR